MPEVEQLTNEAREKKHERSGRLLAELVGTVCRCGELKEVNNTFCKPCYFRLPSYMRKSLYRRFGSGYFEAYESAAAFLDEMDALNQKVRNK